MFNANGTAYAAAGALPKRLGIFFWGNGVKLDRWNPMATGPDWMPNVENAPLMPVKDYVSVISGMSVKTGSEQGHHAGAVGILSGYPMVKQPANGAPFRSTFSSASIDVVAANSIGKDSAFQHLPVGISTRVNGNEGTTLKYLSHNGPDNPNPPDYDPGKVFTRIFGMGFTPPMQTGGDHDRTHTEAGTQPLVSASRIFIMQCFADLLLALKGITEGAGNVLDNTVILGSSDVADGHDHTLTDYPLIVAGKAGGFLKYPGVHYRSTTAENASTVLLTVLRAAGVTGTDGQLLKAYGGGGGAGTTP